MKKTALYDRHVALGGKMVSFSGWNMPLHYGSQIEEHHAVRHHVGLFDVSHMQAIDLAGSEATAFLRHLLANDVKKLYPGKALYTCMLNDAGGIKDDLIVYQLSETQYFLVVNAGAAEKDLAWMQEKSNGFAVNLTPYLDRALLAVQGPEAKATLEKAGIHTDIKPFHFESRANYLIARTGYTGEDGYEISLPNAQIAALWDELIALSARPCGLGARDTLRLEAGLNLYGHDMDETTHPFESNLAWTLDFTDLKREFIGRQALEHQLKVGVDKQLIGVALKDQGIIREGMLIYSLGDPQDIGKITSGGFSPTLNLSIGLARVRQTALTTLELALRQKHVNVQVVKPPFIRAGKTTFDIKS